MRRRGAWALVVWGAAIAGADAARAQPVVRQVNPEERAGRASLAHVVLIRATLGEAESFGAGVVFGVGPDLLYIASANHVVRTEDSAVASRVRLRFYVRPDTTFEGTVLPTFVTKLDVAVVAVALTGSAAALLDSLPFELRPAPESLVRRQRLYPVGHDPGDTAFVVPAPDEGAPLQSGDSLLLRLDKWYPEGYSGGPVFTGSWRFVGMMLASRDGQTQVLRAQPLLAQLTAWDLPVDIQRQGRSTGGAPLRQLSAAGDRTCAIAADRALYCWGDVPEGETLDSAALCDGPPDAPCRGAPRRLRHDQRFQSVAVGGSGNQSCAVDTEGTLACWGAGAPAQVPAAAPDSTSFTLLAVGGSAACAAGATAVRCWGDNRFGQLGLGAAPAGADSAVAAADSVSLAASALALGDAHACVVTRSGKLYCWGRNNHGQLGLRDSVDRTAPVLVEDAHRFSAVVAGANHTCALSVGRQVHCWGDNASGQLGRSARASTEQLDDQPVDSGVFALAAGPDFTCAVTLRGTVRCWGANPDGVLGTDESAPVVRSPSPVTALPDQRFSALAAGRRHVCGTVVGGGVHCWGRNDRGQLGARGRMTMESHPVAVRPPADGGVQVGTRVHP